MVNLVSPPKNLGPAICIICGKSAAGSIKKHQHIRDAFEMKTPGQWDLCKEHKKLHQEGFIALVEAVPPGLEGEEAHRTGPITHVRYELAEQLFKTAIDRTLPMVFCYPDVSSRFKEMVGIAGALADKKSS